MAYPWLRLITSTEEALDEVSGHPQSINDYPLFALWGASHALRFDLLETVVDFESALGPAVNGGAKGLTLMGFWAWVAGLWLRKHLGDRPRAAVRSVFAASVSWRAFDVLLLAGVLAASGSHAVSDTAVDLMTVGLGVFGLLGWLWGWSVLLRGLARLTGMKKRALFAGLVGPALVPLALLFALFVAVDLLEVMDPDGSPPGGEEVEVRVVTGGVEVEQPGAEGDEFPKPPPTTPDEVARVPLEALSSHPVREYSRFNFGRSHLDRTLSTLVAASEARSALESIRNGLPAGHVAWIGTVRDLGDEVVADHVELVVAVGTQPTTPIVVSHVDPVNYGMTPSGVAAQLEEWDRSFGVSVDVANSEDVEFRLGEIPRDLKAFLVELERLCPDGDQAYQSAEDRLAAISQRGEVKCWWD